MVTQVAFPGHGGAGPGGTSPARERGERAECPAAESDLRRCILRVALFQPQTAPVNLLARTDQSRGVGASERVRHALYLLAVSASASLLGACGGSNDTALDDALRADLSMAS